MGGLLNLFSKDVKQTTNNSAKYDIADNSLNTGDNPIIQSGGSSITINSSSSDPAIAATMANLATNALGLANGDNQRATILAQDALVSGAMTAQAALDASNASAQLSASVAARAIDANSSTTDTAIRAGVKTSETAIAAAQEAARVAASAITQNSAAAIGAAQESARVAASAATQAAQAAAASAAESSRVAISGVTQTADRALSSNTEVTRLGYSAILQGQDRALDTADRAVSVAAGVASDSTENARQIVLANNNLTEKTREGNQELVKLVADKLSTAVADERKNINADLIQSALKWSAGTVIGLAVAIGLAMALRKKA